MKSLMSTVSVLCWVGRDGMQPDIFVPLTQAFDALDPGLCLHTARISDINYPLAPIEAGFQDLRRLTGTILTFRAREKRALDKITELLKAVWLRRQERLVHLL